MFARRSMLLVASAVLLGCPAAALAQRAALQAKPPLPGGKHCLGEERTKLVLNHTVVGAVNPLGLENQLRLSMCTPLVRRPGLLFDFSNLEIGVANYISPTHIHLGPFLNVTPLSILVLRAEVTGLFIWPIPLPGAGYVPVDGYDKFSAMTLDPPLTGPGSGRRAYGVRTALGATLQGQVPFGHGVSLAIVNSFTSEYWRVRPIEPFEIGEAQSHFYLARRDLVASADGDWILANTAVALVMIDIKKNYVVRLGVTDDLVAVPASGYIGNIVAGIAAVMVRNVSTLARNLQLFVRMGGYTNHGYREGITLAAGLDVYYELMKR
jgi:hypothetical protein